MAIVKMTVMMEYAREGTTLLKQRVITAVIMVIVLYGATAWLPLSWFAGFVSLAFLPALLEWSALAGLRRFSARCLFLISFLVLLGLSFWFIGNPLSGSVDEQRLALLCGLALCYWLLVFRFIRYYPDRTHEWDSAMRLALMGLVALLPTWWVLVYLKMLSQPGWLVFCLIALVSVADIGAYFAGRRWGQRKLAPDLSPNKSWEGVWGGMFACLLVAALLLSLVHVNLQPLPLWQWLILLLTAMLVAAVSVVGDLSESMLKRQRGVKDSGRCLPGHGGLLDRVDSLLAAAPVFALAVVMVRLQEGGL